MMLRCDSFLELLLSLFRLTTGPYFLISLVFCARAAIGADLPVESFTRTTYVFGTQVSITLEGVTKRQADRAYEQLKKRLSWQHKRWHPWRPSALQALNQELRQGKTVTVSEDFLALTQQSKQFWRQSQGLFNPAAGQLFELWGFHQDIPHLDKEPDAATLKRLVTNLPSMEHILIGQGTLSGRHAMIKLDFGGVAKGFSLDSIVNELKSLEVPAALINAGGDIRAFGRNVNDPWKVAVQDPANAQGVLGFIEIFDDESIVSSGTYERYYRVGERRIHHILDPRTGRPAEGTLGVTVIASNGTLADAAATALLIAGKNNWREIASAMKLDDVLLVTDNKEVILSQSMVERFRPISGRQK